MFKLIDKILNGLLDRRKTLRKRVSQNMVDVTYLVITLALLQHMTLIVYAVIVYAFWILK